MYQRQQPRPGQWRFTGPANAQPQEHVAALAAAAAKICIVQAPVNHKHDSLWAIAERHLGDGARYNEIFELNKHRLQPDGQRLRLAGLIQPGWQLFMPADAAGLPEQQVAVQTPAPAPVAAAAPVKPAPKPAVAAARPAASPEAATPHAAKPAPAAAEQPLEELNSEEAQPQAGTATPSIAAVVPTTSQADRPPDPASAAVASGVDRNTDGADEDTHSVVNAAGEWGGGTLLAAGLLAALAQLRRRQRRRRANGRRVPRISPELAVTELGLRVAAEPADVEFLNLALRSLGVLISESAEPLPEVLAARLTHGGLELMLQAPAPPAPAPWINIGDSMWSLAQSEEFGLTPETAGSALSPWPGLVPVGRDDRGLILLDLEAFGSIALLGARAQVTPLLAWVATELAVNAWSDYLQVTLVGFDAELATLNADRFRVVDVLDDALLNELGARARHLTAYTAQVLGGVLASRVRQGDGEGWMPEFLLLGGPPEHPSDERLLAAGADSPRAATAVVVAGEWEQARYQLHIDEVGMLRVPSLGLLIFANRLTERAAAMLPALFESALDESDIAPAESPPAAAPASGEQGAVAEPHADRAEGSASTVLQAADVGEDEAPFMLPSSVAASESRFSLPATVVDLVRKHLVDPGLDDDVAAWFDEARTDIARVSLIGTPQITAPGAIAKNREATACEIVMYLAAHGRVVMPAALDAAIWPNQQVLAATRVENVSRARKWLGVNAAGESHLPAAPAGSPLRLQAGALLDWELFQRLHKRAEAASSADDATWDLVNALRLVRGKPFEVIPTGRYSWLAEVYLEQDIPAAVVDAAHHLAALRLAAGDANGAREAARVAQRVDRYDERPWRDLMEAENLAGDVKRVRELRDELLQLVESVVEDELMPETQELLQRLLPRDRRLAVG